MSTRGRLGSTLLPTSTPMGLKFRTEKTEKVHRQLISNRLKKNLRRRATPPADSTAGDNTPAHISTKLPARLLQ